MVQYTSTRLDASFAALSDATRRGVLEHLDAAGTGAADAMVETFDQLDELLVALRESSGQ